MPPLLPTLHALELILPPPPCPERRSRRVSHYPKPVLLTILFGTYHRRPGKFGLDERHKAARSPLQLKLDLFGDLAGRGEVLPMSFGPLFLQQRDSSLEGDDPLVTEERIEL